MSVIDFEEVRRRQNDNKLSGWDFLHQQVKEGMSRLLRNAAASISADDSRSELQAEIIAETVVRMAKREPQLIGFSVRLDFGTSDWQEVLNAEVSRRIQEAVTNTMQHCATEFVNVAPYLCLPLEIPQRR